MLLQEYKSARKHAGMGVAFPEGAPGLHTSAADSGTSLIDPATRALLEALQRNEARSQAREEACVFKPSQWGDALDDQDMLAFSNDELAVHFAKYKKIFKEEPPKEHRPQRSK